MLIKDLFEKDIARHVNGVVKADQLDESSVWQELDEFVVTQELSRHLLRFFENYRDALDRSGDPDVVGNIGVWVSGFFGSGKSHFIKVLSYLLKNDVHTYHGQSQRAASFFDSKIQDPMLIGDIKRAAASSADVILFNIDSKADRTVKDPLLQVFVKVLNELAGYSSDYPQIASIERHLEKHGQLQAFHDAYRARAGVDWLENRDAWHFSRDQLEQALSEAIGQSVETSRKLLDTVDEQYPLSIENFCQWVRDFIDRKGPAHRIVFLVDEVGQFIGTDAQLMLRLQTITEMLGTTCGGRAWVVVTSQEDIDKIVGSVDRSRANDFSKIQGRFRTRLSLSSVNVEEVIEKRLLAKRPEVRSTLEKEFGDKGDILKNQMSFRDVGMTLASYDSSDVFVRHYPVAPYQFRLLQKIFEAIRDAGATGKHLSRGERSLLDAFQQAIQLVSENQVGVLIPLYRFYPAIENFLDTKVKGTIEHSVHDPALRRFDTSLLQVLFLVRYVTEIKGNVDNLVTLCLDEIDAPRLELRKNVEASLGRLEKQTLISRNGDIYAFLTSEEQEISRKINRTDIDSSKAVRELGKLIFEDVLRDRKKHRHSGNMADFTLYRISDGYPFKSRVNGALTVSVITPLNEDYERYQDPTHCKLESEQNDGTIVIRLGDDSTFESELKTMLRTESYLLTQDDGTLAHTTRKIHQDIAEQNRLRRTRLVRQVGAMITRAQFFIAGSLEPVDSQDAAKALAQALDYLIKNTFYKMGYVDRFHEGPLEQAARILGRSARGQSMLDPDADKSNVRALDDLREHLTLSARMNNRVVLADLVFRYYKRPYGWPDGITILLLSRLLFNGEVQFLEGSAAISKERLADALTTRKRWKSIVVRPRERIDASTLKAARQLLQRLIAEVGPEDGERLLKYIRTRLEGWQYNLKRFHVLQQAGQYPGSDEVESALSCIGSVLRSGEGNEFFTRFIKAESELLTASQDIESLTDFYEHQRSVWDELCAALNRFNLNDLQLVENDGAAGALKRLREIRNAPRPYAMIKEVDTLVGTVARVNSRLISENREVAEARIEFARQAVRKELQKHSPGDAMLKSESLAPLQRLAERVGKQDSIAHIAQAAGEAGRIRDVILKKIREHCADGKPVPLPPRPIRQIYPAQITSQAFLETKADVDAFLEELRSKLICAIDEDARVEIR